ncbi:MAG: DUF4340 domain-containing protein [Desulfobacterales bacterium]|nr:DUF4340 domain-containing protein [Desulfobacterales bacterium]MCP4163604.1 DUF4340 domain-containing protein [Deltaproteobacteria bacterium]
MKISKEYIILLTIIAALSLYLLFSKVNQTNYSLPELEKIQVSDVDRIEIKKDKGSIILVKKDEFWFVGKEKYKSDSSLVSKLLKNISDFKLTTLISSNEDFGRYELDEKKRIEVIAYRNDKILRSFQIGKTASSYSHTFVKVAKNSSVYHVEGNIRYDFDKKSDDFRDKLALTLNMNGIKKVEILYGTKKSVLAKSVVKDTTDPKKKDATVEVWKDTKNKEIKKAYMDSFFSELKLLKCSEYIKDKAKKDFSNPDYSIRFYGKDENHLKMYKSGDDYIFDSSQNDYPFKISSWTKDQILKNIKKLK